MPDDKVPAFGEIYNVAWGRQSQRYNNMDKFERGIFMKMDQIWSLPDRPKPVDIAIFKCNVRNCLKRPSGYRVDANAFITYGSSRIKLFLLGLTFPEPGSPALSTRINSLECKLSLLTGFFFPKQLVKQIWYFVFDLILSIQVYYSIGKIY